ncbi:hypothetical protein FRB94_002531 [Tulasnella sp. JGI-2019a]|nr:hypothetical protein FRB94_002531 [Tulasnella sp. JGI-2019a]
MATATTRDGLSSMKRSQLQRLCKQNHLRGNLKTAELIDLLVTHFEEQNRRSVSERTTATPASAPTPQGSVHDENCQASPNFVLLEHNHQSAHPTNILHLEPLDILNLDLLPSSPLAEGGSTSYRLNTLETLCTRLLTHATTATTIIADLKTRLDTAEASIVNLTAALDDTRAQLTSANFQITALHASAITTDQRITDTSSAMTAEIGRTKQLVESVGSRLTQAQERWRDNLPDNDNIFLFEPPAATSRSDRSRSKEPLSGSTVSWAAHQQSITGNLAPPAVRLFTSGSSTIGPSPQEVDECDDDRPNTSSSSIRTRFPSVVPVFDSHYAPVHPSSSWSSEGGAQKPGVGDTQHPDAACNSISLSSKVAGKRPASPTPIPTDPHHESYDIRATKRTRYSLVKPQVHPEDSSSLQSMSTAAESPLVPPSPMIIEPSTPPNRRTTLLLPPVEILSTPSPSSKPLRRQGDEHLESHGFATTPRPPMQGPTSPTLESPRRHLIYYNRNRKDVQPPRNGDTFSAPLESNAASLGRSSVEPCSRAEPSSPAMPLVEKGKAVGASVDPRTATVAPLSRSKSLGSEIEEDVTMTDVADSPGRPNPRIRQPYRSKDPNGSKRQSVTPSPPAPATPSPGTLSNHNARTRARSSSSSRSFSFFAPPAAPKAELPAGMAMLYPHSVLAPPPPPPHNINNASGSGRSSHAVPPPQHGPSLLSRGRWGTSPGILPGDRPRVHPSANTLRDYAADPDDVLDADVSPTKSRGRNAAGSGVSHTRNMSGGGSKRVSFWSQWTKDDGKADSTSDGDWTRMWGR